MINDGKEEYVRAHNKKTPTVSNRGFVCKVGGDLLSHI